MLLGDLLILILLETLSKILNRFGCNLSMGQINQVANGVAFSQENSLEAVQFRQVLDIGGKSPHRSLAFLHVFKVVTGSLSSELTASTSV